MKNYSIFKFFLLIFLLALTVNNLMATPFLVPPFSLSISRGGISRSGEVIQNKFFSFEICLKSYKEPLESITMNITLPPEVDLHKGDLSWSGELKQKSKQCLYVLMKSSIDWSEWSSEINAHVEHIYEGEKYSRDIKWSAKGYEDTCWQGKNADYYNRWCIK